MTYSKISDDSWYGANDTIITAKQTEDLSIQSNIYIYKETEASAEIPQICNIESNKCLLTIISELT